MNSSVKLIIASLFSAQFVFASPKVQRWENGIIDLNFYKRLVTTENCESSLQKFAGCMESLLIILNVSLGYKSSSEFLILEGSDVLSEFDAQSTKMTFGFLNFVAVTPKKRADLLNQLQENGNNLEANRNRLLRAYFEKLFNLALQTKEKPYQLMLEHFSKSSSAISAQTYAKAINEYLKNAVDPHSMLMHEKTFLEEMTKKTEIDKGLGIYFRVSLAAENVVGLKILSTFNDSPAKKAGLKKRDLITHLNGLKISNESLEQIINILGDPAVQDVEILAERGEDIHTFKLQKQSYEVDNISETVIEFGGKNIGYVKLNQFQMDLDDQGLPKDCAHLAESFMRFQRLADAAILDLRDNGGGSVDTATCIAAIFLGGGARVGIAKKIDHQFFPSEIMNFFTKNDANGPPKPDTVFFDSPKNLNMVYGKPLVVLVNQRSASSSELLAAALRDHNRAFIVGTQTFGKGTTMSPVAKTKESDLVSQATQLMQRKIESTPEKRLIILGTDYRFYSPKGSSHHGTGLKPHIDSFERLAPGPNELRNRREADRFLFPLTAKPLEEAASAATAHMNRLVPLFNCINEAGLSEYYKSLDDSELEKDMQILTGAQQLVCMYLNSPQNRYSQSLPKK